MSSFETYLNKIQTLTDQNLQILNLLNNAFYSKNEHVSAIIGDSTYSIPSFLHIENKLNDLEGNWERLVSSPLYGEAAFVLDGSTRKIQIAGYETSPQAIETLTPADPDHAYIEANDVFKDFITPLLSVKFDLSGIESSVTSVNVRKVVFRSDALTQWMDGFGDGSSAMVSTDWMTVGAKLEAYKEDVDYVMYDKIYRLPLRITDYNGSFTVKDVTVTQDGNDILWDATIDGGYTYTYDQGKMTADLKAGDLLLTDGNGCKLIVKSIDYNAKKITLVVESGYFSPGESNMLTLYVPDENKSKILSIPLEEDSHIAVFIAPVNDSLNTSAAWSGGQFIWADNLKYNDTPFRDVYDEKVKNLGDILYDLTSFIGGTLSNVTEDEMTLLTSVKPTLEAASDSVSGDYDVVLLNDHLLDNDEVEHIRTLNNEKAAISAELQTLANQIQLIKSELASTDMSDQVKTYREDMQKRLDEYNTKNTAKTAELINKINEISQAVSNTVLPGVGSKYVIRGAVPVSALETEVKATGAKVVKIDIMYRYKNINRSTSNATAISDALTVGDWNKYIIDARHKHARWDSNLKQIVYEFESEQGDDGTAASWRVFNIPIQQGETVDFRCRVVWDLGWPYVCMTSDWCDVMNVEFPDDLVDYTDIPTIITDNRNDIQDNTIKQELLSEGVTEHINDEVIDQDQTYFHRPESISSGFYTDDSRRVIPLSTKLREMSDAIAALQLGSFANGYKNLKVTVSDEYRAITLTPDMTNGFTLPSWNDISGDVDNSGNKTHIVYITIENNNQSYPMELYSMFPGDHSIKLDSSNKRSKFDKYPYEICTDASGEGTYKGIECIDVVNRDDSEGTGNSQRLGQFLYFRSLNKWTGKEKDTTQDYVYTDTNKIKAICTPESWNNITTASSEEGSSYSLPGGTAISLPMTLSLKLDSSTNAAKTTTIAFDVWTSPFNDPITYIIKFFAYYNGRGIKKLTDAAKNNVYSPIIRKPNNSIGVNTLISSRSINSRNNA